MKTFYIIDSMAEFHEIVDMYIDYKYYNRPEITRADIENACNECGFSYEGIAEIGDEIIKNL